MATDDLLRLVPEDLFGALVEVDDVLLLIDADDRIGGDAEDAANFASESRSARSAVACSETRSSSSRCRESKSPIVPATAANAARRIHARTPSRWSSVSVRVSGAMSATAAIHSAVRIRRE